MKSYPKLGAAKGRPRIGPKIDVRVPLDILALIDAECSISNISRAQWFRLAAEYTLGKVAERA